MFIATLIHQKFPDDADAIGPFDSWEAANRYLLDKVRELYPEEWDDSRAQFDNSDIMRNCIWNKYARGDQGLPLLVVAELTKP